MNWCLGEINLKAGENTLTSVTITDGNVLCLIFIL